MSETIKALAIHLVPAIVMLLVVIISWKHELVGAVAFFLGGIGYIIALAQNPFEWYLLAWGIEISGMAFLTGALFLIGWSRKRR